MTGEPRRFDAAAYPEGMRCTDCKKSFVNNQIVEERITGVDTVGALADMFPEHSDGPDELLVYTQPICLACALGDPPDRHGHRPEGGTR